MTDRNTLLKALKRIEPQARETIEIIRKMPDAKPGGPYDHLWDALHTIVEHHEEWIGARDG